MGTTRNGAISMVRTAPRPGNLRSSSSASSRPITRLISTTVTVSSTVVHTDLRSSGVVRTSE
jgi:hypothetical protein